MILYPTIELQNGHCVSLTRGDLDQPMIWHVDPVEKAKEFVASGAEWLQVTDFDAIVGDDQNAGIVEEIISTSGGNVQVAGGIRTQEQVERWIEKGAGRVVIGTLATQDPELVKSLAMAFPDQVVLAVDVWEDRVMTEGWKTKSGLEPSSFIKAYEGTPFAAIQLTDIASDVSDTEASLGLLTALSSETKTPVIASGMVRNVDDLSRLNYVGNIQGAVVGRALFRKTIDLKDAFAATMPQTEPTAQFI
ncbi:HisA/HisF-related TIM barrel protein [Halocynthiibacter namhaensis]|uniref:1-(5-phosphoribosyl)-5-[(5- phosphoribosylamino)methylideneamino]imidazole-4- carboxamide isomerase n=1 Tax=Halocynthiibacter namhaensis TaxID=1290553 RepID=UPI000579080A|nr:1-(5-phosphoribosyl)-5-[(5-phosphoribosylamino)methylideneamino] imidazole-4-carboxamide isomerase [Halocynthiibacter namhaensis]